MTRKLLAVGLSCMLFACVGRVQLGESGPGSGDDAGVMATVPLVHRAVGSICPTTRAPGMICTESSDAGASTCSADSDCTAGTNGRCNSPNGPAPICEPASCTYDECTTDANCPSKTPCQCRSILSANTCTTGGNCAVDSDCGPNGYCSPGAYTQYCEVPLYFCHTPKDTCVNDSDCVQPPVPNQPQTCNYDAEDAHFACGDDCSPPP